jgi:Mg-chelatase subunit ChlD
VNRSLRPALGRAALLLLAGAIGVPGCASRAPAPAPAPAAVVGPLADAVELVSGDAEARAPGAAAFSRLAKGAATRVDALKTDRGATLAVRGAGGVRAKVWLAEGAEATLREDQDRRLVVDVTKGEARVRGFGDDAIAIASKDGARRAESRDVLVHARAGGAEVTPTMRAPDAAAWTITGGAREPEAAGIGSLRVGASDAERDLTLASVSVTARVDGDVAETVVEHVFHNDGSDRVEGTFRFPLPEGATLVGLAIEIDGKMSEGEFVEIDKARRIYQEIVDEMRDPAILEWEHGSTFKVRVFPIEPRADKRVVIRYVAPLREPEFEGGPRAYVYPAAPRTPMTDVIPRFSLAVDGRKIVDAQSYRPRGELAVDVAAQPKPAVIEQRSDGTYLAVRVRADRALAETARATSTARPDARALIVVCDTSRSALESKALVADTLDLLLAELGPRDVFTVVAADVDARDAAPNLLDAGDANVARAKRFLADVEPDGASDVGAAIEHAGEIAARARKADPSRPVEIVYVGDGRATWGETDGAALATKAKAALAGASFAALLLGDADVEAMTAIAQGAGGFVERARSRVAVHRAAVELAHPGSVPRLAAVEISAEGAEVAAPPVASIRMDDELVVPVRVPPGGVVPASLHVTARSSAGDVAFDAPITAPAPARRVARRWAAAEIAALEGDPANKDAVVKLSIEHGVLSKHTALLVLENEEAYRKFSIERKAKQRAEEPKVSGADLESLSGGARLSMDRVQPGDPELFIPAPRDAQRVVVVFPWGETKEATLEPATGQWSVRFLVGVGTPDGTHVIAVRVTRADGSAELLEMPYVVDTKRPELDVTLAPSKTTPGAIDVVATQRIDDALVALARAGGARSTRAAREKVADLQRVQVRFPDGAVVALEPRGAGELAGTWTPGGEIDGPIKLHVVGFDRALNQTAFDVDAVVTEAAAK